MVGWGTANKVIDVKLSSVESRYYYFPACLRHSPHCWATGVGSGGEHRIWAGRRPFEWGPKGMALVITQPFHPVHTRGQHAHKVSVQQLEGKWLERNPKKASVSDTELGNHPLEGLFWLGGNRRPHYLAFLSKSGWQQCSLSTNGRN